MKSSNNIYMYNNTTTLNSSGGYSNIYFGRNYRFDAYYPDILRDTDYYKMQKLDELKTSMGSSSGGGSSSVNVDMTDTNNLLYTILIAICVIIICFGLKKLFFRGIK